MSVWLCDVTADEHVSLSVERSIGWLSSKVVMDRGSVYAIVWLEYNLGRCSMCSLGILNVGSKAQSKLYIVLL